MLPRRDRFRRFARLETKLRRAHVSRLASDWLAGPVVGGGFRLQGDTAVFNVEGIKIAAPRKFVWNFVENTYEPDLTAWLRQNLVRGAVVIDAGAHVGYLSILMSNLVGADGHVYAIEPALENVTYLMRNARANRAFNVEVLPVALADRPGIASFNINGSSDSFGFFEHPNTATLSSRSVPVMSIDSIFESALTRLDLIKIDVEGAELEVLEGLTATLGRFPRAVLVVEWFPAAYTSRGLQFDALPNQLEALGYTATVLDAADGGPSTVEAVRKALAGQELPAYWYCNLLVQR